MDQQEILDGLQKFSETILQNINVYKTNWMMSKTYRDHPGTGVDGHCRFFDSIQFTFVKIEFLCKGFEKPVETFQTSKCHD